MLPTPLFSEGSSMEVTCAQADAASAKPQLAWIDVEALLACPHCHGRLTLSSSQIRCTGAKCRFEGEISNGVLVLERRTASYFDDKHQVMEHGSATPGVRRLCYAEQAKIIESSLAPSTTVLDVGCGPALPYRRTVPYFLIGIDPSYESLRQNLEVDLRVYGYAHRLPLADRSIDTIVALYAIHHFAGRNRADNYHRVGAAFAEFGRVAKPGGSLFIFELEPLWPVWGFQCVVWNLSRRLFPRIDMLFWRQQSLSRLAAEKLGRRSAYRKVAFESPLWTTFAPVFAWPRLRIPGFLFPFRVYLYHWSFIG